MAVILRPRVKSRASSSPRAGVQRRRLHARAGIAQATEPRAVDNPAGAADHDQREGRQSAPLRYVPNGRDLRRGAERFAKTNTHVSIVIPSGESFEIDLWLTGA